MAEERERKGWGTHPRFEPLLTALQEEADRGARQRAQFPRDLQEYLRGYVDGMVRAKGMAGYHGLLTVREEALIKRVLADPKLGERHNAAQAKLARGEELELDEALALLPTFFPLAAAKAQEAPALAAAAREPGVDG